jgi:sec-independent protein translocase protein TatB
MNGTIFGIGPLEVIVVAILILLVFGPERVPGLMRDLGRNMRKLRQYYVAFSSELKKEMEPFQEEIKDIQETAQGLRDDLVAIRDAADIRGIITSSDLEPPKPAATSATTTAEATATQTIAPPSALPAATANGSAPSPAATTAGTAVAEAASPSAVTQVTAAAPVSTAPVAIAAPQVQDTAWIQLGDDNPWTFAQPIARSDKLDDDNPWAS